LNMFFLGFGFGQDPQALWYRKTEPRQRSRA
jgi:hypothetical protein